MSKQSLAKSTFWLIISEIIFNLSGYVIHSAVARLLGPANYGRYGLVVTLTTMVIILIGNGIPTAMAKYISEVFETDAALVLKIKRQAILLQTGLIGLITLVFFLLSPFLANLLGDPSLTPLFRVSTLIIPAFAAASFYFSWFTGLHKFNVQSALKTTRSFLKVLTIVGLAWIWGVPGSILGYALAAFGVFLIAFSLDKLKYTRDLKKVAKTQNLSSQTPFPAKKLLNYAWQIIIFFLAYELLISIDLYLVKGILHDDYLTGIYNAALTVGRIPYYIFYALTIMLLPVVSKHTAANNHALASQVIQQSLRLMLIFLAPIVILLSIYAQPALAFFYGNGYAAAAAPMAILSYGVGFLTLFYVLSFVLNGAGKTRLTMCLALFGFLLNTTLNYFFIKQWDLSGSAAATSLTSVVVAGMIYFFTTRQFGRLLSVKLLLQIALATLPIFLLAQRLPHGRYSFIFSSFFLLAIYLLALYLVKGLHETDLEYVKNLLGQKQKRTEVRAELSGNEPGA